MGIDSMYPEKGNCIRSREGVSSWQIITRVSITLGIEVDNPVHVCLMY